MTQFLLLIDKNNKKVKKIAKNDIQKIQLKAESIIYSYADRFNSIYPSFIKLPKLYEKGEDYIVIEYIPHTQKEIKNPLIMAQTLLKLWNFFSIPNKGIIRTISKLDNILRGYRFKDSFIEGITELFKDKFNEISGNYTGIIHRDLHFDHILQDNEGNIYLIDFGTATPGLIEEDLAIFLLNMLKARRADISCLKNILHFFDNLINIINSRIAIGDLNKITAIYSFVLADFSSNNYDKINWINVGLEALENKIINPYAVPILKDSLEGKILHIEWGVPGGVRTYLDTLVEYISKTQPKLEHQRAFYREVYGKDGPGEIYSSDLDKLLQRADIIHVHNYQVGLPNSSIYKKIENLNKPIIWTVHGVVKSLLKNVYGLNESEVNLSPYVLAEENLIMMADTIALNSYLYEEIKREYSNLIKDKNIVLAEPASDIWRYKIPIEEAKSYKRKLINNKEGFAILYHGRITSHKGLMELILATHNLPNVYLIMAGPTGDLNLLDAIVTPSNIVGVNEADIKEVKKVAEELLSQERLIYVSTIQDRRKIAKLIRAADLVVQPTFYDSFNLALLESILLGTPILTTKIAAPEHYFKSVAVRVDWPQSFDKRITYLKKGIEAAMENYNKLKETTTKWRRYFIIRHHPYVLINKYARIYQDLLNK